MQGVGDFDPFVWKLFKISDLATLLFEARMALRRQTFWPGRRSERCLTCQANQRFGPLAGRASRLFCREGAKGAVLLRIALNIISRLRTSRLGPRSRDTAMLSIIHAFRPSLTVKDPGQDGNLRAAATAWDLSGVACCLQTCITSDAPHTARNFSTG